MQEGGEFYMEPNNKVLTYDLSCKLIKLKMSSDLVVWLRTIPGFLDELQRSCLTDDLSLADRLCSRSEHYLSLLNCLLRRAQDSLHNTINLRPDRDGEVIALLTDLREAVFSLYQHFQERTIDLVDKYPQSQGLGLPNVVHATTPGRPCYDIPRSQLEGLSDIGFSYTSIARLLYVSPRTIRRRRQEYGLPVGAVYCVITDQELDGVIMNILQVSIYCMFIMNEHWYYRGFILCY